MVKLFKNGDPFITREDQVEKPKETKPTLFRHVVVIGRLVEGHHQATISDKRDHINDVRGPCLEFTKVRLCRNKKLNEVTDIGGSKISTQRDIGNEATLVAHFIRLEENTDVRIRL